MCVDKIRREEGDGTRTSNSRKVFVDTIREQRTGGRESATSSRERAKKKKQIEARKSESKKRSRNRTNNISN